MRGPDEAAGRDERPPRSSGLTLVGLLGGAVVAALLFGQLTTPDPPPRLPTAAAATTASDLPTGPEPDKPIGVESIKRCPLPVGALTLGDHLRQRGWSIDVWDCSALTEGPWSLVIRSSDGRFGVRSAVVTFPLPERGFRSPQDPPQPQKFGELGTPATKPPGGKWIADSRSLIWPVGGARALMIGDLGQAQLADLAMHITLERGRPELSALDGFEAQPPTTFRFPVVHKLRYQTTDLGLGAKLGSGQVWTGVLTGAALESMLLSDGAKPAGLVRGEPAIYSSSVYPEWMSFGPDSGTLAWESAPGEVSYVGFSGTASKEVAVVALRELANNGKALTLAQWRSRDRVQVFP